jgi:hypothetical protein
MAPFILQRPAGFEYNLLGSVSIVECYGAMSVSVDEGPRRRLCEIVAKYGTSVCDDVRRCEGLLRDLCGELRGVNVLIVALKERVPADLLRTSAAIPKEVLLARLVRRLEENHGISGENASWAVQSWAIAFGMIGRGEAGTYQERSEWQRGTGSPVPNSGSRPKRDANPSRQPEIAVSFYCANCGWSYAERLCAKCGAANPWAG